MFFVRHHVLVKHHHFKTLIWQKRLSFKNIKVLIETFLKSKQYKNSTLYINQSLLSKKQIKQIIYKITHKKVYFITKDEDTLNNYVSDFGIQFKT